MTTPPLKLLQIDLTDECPLFCAHCSNSSGPTCSGQFPIKKLLEILNEAKDLGLEKIVFSGGEPLCYSDLSTALCTSQNAQIPVSMFTTGIRDKKTRLPISVEDWRELAKLGLYSTAFSVYASPERRNYHNQVVRSVPKVGDAFGANEQAMINARLAGLAVDVHFVPSEESIGDLQDIYTWAARVGCSVLHLQIPTYQGRNRNQPALQLSRDAEARLKALAFMLKPQIGKTQFYVSRLWLSRWDLSGDSNCVANLEQLIVRTDGTISPCNACKYGSVTRESENVLAKDATLTGLWKRSQTLQEFRSSGGKLESPRCEGILAIITGLAAVHA